MLSKEVILNQTMSRRSFIVYGFKMSLMGVLVCKLFNMQILKQEQYKMLSDKNRTHLLFIAPKRGVIYDVNGKVLAMDVKYFNLMIDKTDKKHVTKDLQQLQRILNLSIQDINSILFKLKKSDNKLPEIVIQRLTWKQIALIEEHKCDLKSIFISIRYSRFYPYANIASNILGYLGKAAKADNIHLNKITKNTDLQIGKAGIEKFYNDKIVGEIGYKQVEIDAYGNHVQELSTLDSKNGENIRLNIDIEIQQAISPYLNQYGCSVVVMDCTNGSVLICASSPSFDPNHFTQLPFSVWNDFVSNPYKPLINKPVQNSYPPGSIFKIITILAALEAGIPENTLVQCTGNSIFGTNSFRCRSAHGFLTMEQSLQYSCNHYMYEMAKRINAGAIIAMANKFGFGQLTNIDLPSESPGFLPSIAWKQKKLKSAWNIGDTLNLSIGQGFLSATPLQLARFVSAIANEGRLLTPNIANISNNNTNNNNNNNTNNIHNQNLDIEISKQHLQLVKRAMYSTVNEVGGSAYNSRIAELHNSFAGKTGTAQVQSKAHSKDDLNSSSIAWHKRNHALFVGFAPYINPKYAISVFVDHGGSGGQVAAPIASKVMLEVFKKYP